MKLVLLIFDDEIKEKGLINFEIACSTWFCQVKCSYFDLVKVAIKKVEASGGHNLCRQSNPPSRCLSCLILTTFSLEELLT